VLHLIPTQLADPILASHILPAETIRLVQGITHVVAENAKSARAFLKALGIAKPLADISICELNAHTPKESLPSLLEPARLGFDLALVSEAGAPGVADPGAELVASAHREGIRVRPAVGPSAILLGLMASGLDGQRFAFHGYLPVDKPARALALRELERESKIRRMTQLFIETPYRNDALLTEVLTTLRPDTRLCVASGLTGDNERIETRPIADWRQRRVMIGKVPALFLFQA
jgi:16S rRNA (cytidine1402-2'-O)-methyltransferase